MNQIQQVEQIASSEEMRKKEADFDKLAIEIFSHYKVYEHIDLIAPNVLVRILPKDMYVGSIYVMDGKQTNKPVWEGIVLKTWRRRFVPVGRVDQYPHPDSAPSRYEICSELEPGDHVLFPHFAGQPIPGLDTDVYRSIPEGINRGGAFVFGNETGVIFAKVNYQRESVHEVLRKILIETGGDKYRTEEQRQLDILRRLREEFDFSVKVKGSRTLSGR